MSVFREVLLFLDGIGLYDVILPLLLIFTIVYAILDKTKLFGEEKTSFSGQTAPRKNINSMVAFVVAFFVVASSRLVATIHALVSQVALVIVIFIMFMIMIGTFRTGGDLDNEDKWKKFLMVLSFVAIVLIFLNAVGWLMPMWFWLMGNWSSTLAITAILIGGMALMIVWITKPAGGGSQGDKPPDKP